MGLGMVLVIVLFSSFGNVVAERVMKSQTQLGATVFHNSVIIHSWLVAIYLIYIVIFDVIVPLVKVVSNDDATSSSKVLAAINVFSGWNAYATATIATGFFTGLMSMLVLTYANNIISLFAHSFNVAIIAVWELGVELASTGTLRFEASQRTATFWLAVAAMLASVFVFAKSAAQKS